MKQTVGQASTGRAREPRPTRSRRFIASGRLVKAGFVMALGVGGFVAAPLVGATVGAATGLTGAAAIVHGLAVLGGGAVYSGGMGMAGGLWVVAGSGVLLGMVAGTGAARLGRQVHWIQARKATEDYESWREATVERIDEWVITVLFEGEHEPAHFTSAGAGHLARSSIDRVWVSERWSVLAYPDPEGNVLGIQPPGKNPDSVFDRSGAKRLHYINIARIEPVEYVYASVTGIDGNDYFFALPRDYVEDVADVMRIMNSCKTWGEVRRAASFDRYKEILGIAGYGSLEEYVEHIFVGRPIPGVLEAAAREWEEKNWERGLPADEDPFDPMEIDAYHSGDYPPIFEWLQNTCLPEDLLQEYGERYETSINGTFASIPPDKGPEVVAELERRGHRCVEETDLFRRSMVRW